MEQAMERLRWGQVVEDCGVAVQDLLNAGRSMDAMRVRLVMLHNLHEIVSLIIETRPAGRVEAPAVVAAVDAILNKPVQVPLMSLGQGDYRRDYFEAEVVKTEVKKAEGRNWLRGLCARIGGTR
ncbi:MAG: hypothetical protein EBR82_60075 [Caulobacteraceae bacterium]|nr:hypothetical protein [Caulobacteraceae bacterium]